MISISDFHCDTITRLKDLNEQLYENTGELDIKRLSTFDTVLTTFAICLDGKSTNCFHDTDEYIEYFHRELDINKEYISLVRNYSDIDFNTQQGKINALLAIEGGEAFEGKLCNIKNLYNKGVRIVTLTWNMCNELGNSAISGEKGGLTKFGIDAVKELEQRNMIIDISHLNKEGFWDVAKAIKGAFVATHSNCSSLCDHPRNLDDAQIKEISQRGGIIGINLFPDFININKEAVLKDILPHIDHIVKIGGVDAVCLGSDFDGVRYLPSDIKDILAFHDIANMLNMHYSCSDVEKIMHTNILRLLDQLLI